MNGHVVFWLKSTNMANLSATNTAGKHITQQLTTMAEECESLAVETYNCPVSRLNISII